MRVMYWPNEPVDVARDTRQAGGRAAFAAMVEDGTIEALSIYSYRRERTDQPDLEHFEKAAVNAVRAFAPDIVFVQHVGETGLSGTFWRRLRQEVPELTLIYHEADVFGRWIKRLDNSTIAALRNADLVFACGLGSVARLYSNYTDAPIRFMPHCFLAENFARLDPAAAKKEVEVAMIGNCGRMRKLSLCYMPGGRKRARLAKRLAAAYGDFFALYGGGWSDLYSARGPVSFLNQEATIQSARISANWDHFDTIELYFSNRLPISLAAGVPHVTTWHEGYDEFFAACPGLYPCKSVSEAVDTCRWLLAQPNDTLLAEGLAARKWAFANLEAKHVFRRGLKQAIAFHKERMAS